MLSELLEIDIECDAYPVLRASVRFNFVHDVSRKENAKTRFGFYRELRDVVRGRLESLWRSSP